MQHKNIKRIIKKQLKRDYPYWKKLSKKDKKAIAKSVLEEVVKDQGDCTWNSLDITKKILAYTPCMA